MSDANPPEYNVTVHDYSRREHFVYNGPPIVDIHAHVTMTSPAEKSDGPSGGAGAAGSSDSAALMLEVAGEFGIGRTYSMCPPQDIAPLRARFGNKIGFNGPLSKKLEDSEDVAFRTLEQFLEAGVEIVKLWAAPRGRDRGLILDAPWRIEGVKRARNAGVRIIMVHVGDPEVWWTRQYTDVAKYGSKADQYLPLKKMLEMFPDLTWIGAHMGGDPEHPDHLEALLVEYPHLHFDTSATKWQVREVSRRGDAVRSLISRFPDRFLFGSDLVTRHALQREHFISRYWCQRTLWESSWIGPSPIADPDNQSSLGEPAPSRLAGISMPLGDLTKVYSENAGRLLKIGKL